MGTVHHTDEARLPSGDLEDFGLFYVAIVLDDQLVASPRAPSAAERG